MAFQWKKQASVAYGYALSRLGLNYYTYIEFLEEEGKNEDLSWMKNRLESLLGSYLAGEDILEELKTFRRKIQAEMEVLTAYVDCFRTYEYALNRVERRFDTDVLPILIEEEEFVAQVMHFLTKEKDAAMMNQRIQMVIGQLPIRFTRAKFYSMVSDALSIYIGTDGGALKQMMYLLRTIAMAELSKEQEASQPQLKEMLDELRKLSWKNMTAESYQRSVDIIICASERLYGLSDVCQMVQDMVNDLYVLALTKADAIKQTKEEANLHTLLGGLHSWRASGGQGLIPDEVTDSLYALEGVQEGCYETYTRLASPPEYKEGEPVEAYYGRCVEKLISTSSFVSLEDEVEEAEIEKADLDAATGSFFATLDSIFTSSEKPIVRAIMAAVLSSLPVCFHSVSEIQSYVENSLSSCTDSMEKETCMELLLKIMETEDDLLV